MEFQAYIKYLELENLGVFISQFFCCQCVCVFSCFGQHFASFFCIGCEAKLSITGILKVT